MTDISELNIGDQFELEEGLFEIVDIDDDTMTVVNEDEELFEISKKTLGNYIRKAGDAREKLSPKEAEALEKTATGEKDFYRKKGSPWTAKEVHTRLSRKLNNRKMGMQRAVSRLTKESFETGDQIEYDGQLLEVVGVTDDAVQFADEDNTIVEISGKTLGSYIQKARADISARYDYDKKLENDPSVTKWKERSRDYSKRSRDHFGTERSRLRRQSDAAQDRAADAKYKLDPKWLAKVGKTHNRHQGIKKAIEKLQYGKMTEDFELNPLVTAAISGDPLGFTEAFDALLANRAAEIVEGVHIDVANNFLDEGEYLDELSRKTLKSYKRKATTSADRAWAKADKEEDKSMATDGNKYPEKQARHMVNAAKAVGVWRKRDWGLKQASKRLGEDNEYLDELSKETLRSYIEKANTDMGKRQSKIYTKKWTQKKRAKQSDIRAFANRGKGAYRAFMKLEDK